MNGIRFAEGLQVVPLYAPQTTTADIESAQVKLENMQWLTFLVSVGSLVGDTTALWNIAIKSTTEAGTGSTNSNDYALPFKYRLATLGVDDWGDITAVTTATGYVQFNGTAGNVNYIIDVDPSDIAKHDSDATYVYVDIDITADAATDACYMSIVGVFEPRYPQKDNLTSS
jgi:hypothetical protein